MAVAADIQRAMEDSSWIRRMFELGIQLRQERGPENVFDLSLGNPIAEPPPQFCDELRSFASADTPGVHRYMPNPGYVETRQAVADALSDETGLSYGAEHVVMTVGAAAALNVVIHSLCDRDDEVVILTPFFAEYLFYATNHAAKPVVVGCDSDFVPDLDELERKLRYFAHEIDKFDLELDDIQMNFIPFPLTEYSVLKQAYQQVIKTGNYHIHTYEIYFSQFRMISD